MNAPKFISSTYESDGVAAIIEKTNARIIGKVIKGSKYMVAPSLEVVTAPTLAELKTLLTERGLTFNETPIRPIS